MTTVKLLVFDMNSEFFVSLEQFTRDIPGLEVRGITTNVSASIDDYGNEAPDVIFYASSMLKALGVGMFMRVCEKWPDAHCYRLTLFDESYYDDYSAGKGFKGSVPRSGIEEHLTKILQDAQMIRDSSENE